MTVLYTFIFLISFGLFSSLATAGIEDCQKPYSLDLGDDITIKFCEIPAAPEGFPIGSLAGELDEQPVRNRVFNQSFHMGQHEVTQGQFRTVMGFEPWKNHYGYAKSFVERGDNYPAVYVTLNEAKDFANMLSELDPSATYRLPTEAEWEYAARSKATTTYYWGDEFDSYFAYYSGNSKRNEYPRRVMDCPKTYTNNNFGPGDCANGFGLMHMAGNVWEFTADSYANSYENAPLNGHEPVVNDSGEYVIRGGSWDNEGKYLRPSYRGVFIGADVDDYVVGFRVIRIPNN